MAQNNCVNCLTDHNEDRCPKCGRKDFATDEDFSDEPTEYDVMIEEVLG